MGRTNGKLIPFLKHSLQNNLYMNLRYEDAEVFYFEFPRFDEKKKCVLEEYGKIFKAWCNTGGKKYENYSNGKSVLQAALKKSVYLMKLPIIGKRIRFRFASKDEVKENRRLLRERANAARLNSESASNVIPFSPELSLYFDASSPASSGYHSDGEDNNHQVLNETNAQVMDDLESIFRNEDLSYLDSVDNNILDDINDILKGDITEDLHNTPMTDLSTPANHQSVPEMNFSPESIFQSQFVNNSVVELSSTPVSSEILKKKYWLCKEKLKTGSVLILICFQEVIEHGNQGIQEDQIVIPNEVWEPGINYSLKQAVEVDGKKFCFFIPESV